MYIYIYNSLYVCIISMSLLYIYIHMFKGICMCFLVPAKTGPFVTRPGAHVRYTRYKTHGAFCDNPLSKFGTKAL